MNTPSFKYGRTAAASFFCTPRLTKKKVISARCRKVSISKPGSSARMASMPGGRARRTAPASDPKSPRAILARLEAPMTDPKVAIAACACGDPPSRDPPSAWPPEPFLHATQNVANDKNEDQQPNEAAERAAAAERSAGTAGAVAHRRVAAAARARQRGRRETERRRSSRRSARVWRAWPSQGASSQRTAAVGAKFCARRRGRAALGAVHALRRHGGAAARAEFRARSVRRHGNSRRPCRRRRRVGWLPAPAPHRRRDFVRRLGWARRRFRRPCRPVPCRCPRPRRRCRRRPPLPRRCP